MMYDKGFVVSIHDNENKVLRESKGKKVFLPFDSTYKIRLRNNNNRKAVAEVTIDGTSVLGPNKMVVDANSFEDLERFCIDGDLKNGNQFKFVKSDPSNPHPDVQDPSSPENGNIVVKFWLEKEDEIGFFEDDEICLTNELPKYMESISSIYSEVMKSSLCSGAVKSARKLKSSGLDFNSPTFYSPLHTSATWDIPKATVSINPISDRIMGIVDNPNVSITTKSSFNIDSSFGTDDNIGVFACASSDNLDFCDSIDEELETGATVEGSQSNQQFIYKEIGELEDDYTEIRLTIRPFKKSVRVSDTKSVYCPQCGIKNKYFSNFCKLCFGKSGLYR